MIRVGTTAEARDCPVSISMMNVVASTHTRYTTVLTRLRVRVS